VLLLLAAWIPATAGAADPELGLADAARQALESNLDLAAQRSALAADREEIAIARSTLLPQIDVGAQGQILDDDRSNDGRGTITERSVTVGAGLTQVLYDETSWADYQIQKYVYAAQTQQFRAFELSVVQFAADAFLELDRSQATVDLQERNREITLRNIVTSEARIAAGWSSETEVLRWKAQLAANDSDLVAARTQVLVSRFELNRVRDKPREAPVAPRAASVGEHGFVYARAAIVKAIASPEGDQKLRDFMVRVGLVRSPVLAEVEEAIAAAERQLTADRRAFWLPSLSVGADVNHLAQDGSGAPDLDFNDTQWSVSAGLTFPLLQGGAKFANLRQAREILASLRTQRRAEVVSLGESIRSAFARASGAYAAFGYAQAQKAVARRYFELTSDSYELGVASILRLLDAQTQLLDADIAVTNSLYDFLQALIAAEQTISLYPFLEPEPEVTELLDRLEQQL